MKGRKNRDFFTGLKKKTWLILTEYINPVSHLSDKILPGMRWNEIDYYEVINLQIYKYDNN